MDKLSKMVDKMTDKKANFSEKTLKFKTKSVLLGAVGKRGNVKFSPKYEEGSF